MHFDCIIWDNQSDEFDALDNHTSLCHLRSWSSNEDSVKMILVWVTLLLIHGGCKFYIQEQKCNILFIIFNLSNPFLVSLISFFSVMQIHWFQWSQFNLGNLWLWHVFCLIKDLLKNFNGPSRVQGILWNQLWSCGKIKTLYMDQGFLLQNWRQHTMRGIALWQFWK